MDPSIRHDRWFGAGLAFIALALVGLHVQRVREFRRLAVFDAPVVGVASLATFRGAIERCESRDGRVAVAGWVVRPGVARGPHATRVLLREDAGGSLWRMPTRLPHRIDVHAQLQDVLGDRIDYYSAGFVASVDLRHARAAFDRARVVIAYDEGGGRYTLVDTPCAF